MKLSLPAKKMLFVIAISSVTMIVGGIALCLFVPSIPSGEAFPVALGVFLSSALNVLKVLLLERTVQRVMELETAKESKGYVASQYIVRYVLTGAVLVVAAITPFINLWGAIAGIFTMQIAVFFIRFMKLNED